ncbi:MAG: rhodanese-like domain-containing protein [Taibaiella sp.]|nr:rhodanese-like domain-containing protein [Taibaiella sp.]
MKSITVSELKGWKKNAKKFLLLDVREEWEHAAGNIGGVNIPLGELLSRKEEVDKDETVVVYCEKGIRSAIAIQRLEAYEFHHLINLTGGMTAWKKNV